MPFNLIDYYNALNGELSIQNDVWYINYYKRHAFGVSSDYDALDEDSLKITLPPTEAQTTDIDIFSTQSNQKLNNTKITTEEDGTEIVELELDNRIVTIIIDQSGSMTWNDNNGFRHDAARLLVDRIDTNYPGNIYYNLLEYGGNPVNVVFFGVIEEEGINPYDINTLNSMFQADENANYDGIRIIRNDDHYPTSPVDGELVSDGFVSRILDADLIENKTYYYKVYTYDSDLRLSEGVRIKATPRERVVPRGVSIFRTVVESNDLTKGQPYIGSGVNRDENVIGLWHMDEGEGKYLYDFSDSNLILTHTREKPIWYGSEFVPSGVSGLFFDGEEDAVSIKDTENLAEIDFSGSNNQITIGVWVYPYELNNNVIISRDNGVFWNYILSITSDGYLICGFGAAGATSTAVIQLETYKWQYVALTYDGGADVTFYIAKDEIFRSETRTLSSSPAYTPSSYILGIGKSEVGGNLFKGRMTELSIHNTARSSSYVFSQLVENPIYNSNGDQIATDYVGRKIDNGDRLVVLDYEVPKDHDFAGGEVVIVRNEEHIPSWEEDGTVIYQQGAGDGRFFVGDPLDFAFNETYYYRIFSKNSIGNVSFLSDSPSLSIDISPASDDYFLALTSAISSPQSPATGELITVGNQKVYLRWRQTSPEDSRISRTRIYYSSTYYPIVDKTGNSNGQLVFSGLISDNKFVHRNLRNNVIAYYTIVNVDKYGRCSNYDSDGIQVEGFLHAATVPNSSADEGTIPLLDVSNLYYKLVDNNTVSIGWDQPVKSPENVSAYFDQTVLLYASITDEFGAVMPDDTFIKMYIKATINRESQADDVFESEGVTSFEDIDSYDFFVARTDDGFMKATLRMSTDMRIISQIKNATFTIQLKAYIPKEGYVAPNTTSDSTTSTSLEEYATVVQELTDGETAETTTSSDNIFEYYSKPITVSFTNPWEVELENRDNKEVYQRCYVQKTDELTRRKYLVADRQYFNGIHIKSSNPFVVRAKVKYKGEVVESGDLQVAVWDADSEELCKNAGQENSVPYEGPKTEVSQTVSPPSEVMSIVQGTEEQIGHGGLTIDVPISYVDIPIYAPDITQAVRLFVKGVKSGYSSIKDMYVLFQNILKIEIEDKSPAVDGKETAEQQANVFIINPDYPDYETNDYDKSLITYPIDQTVVEWVITKIEGTKERVIYSIDNVPLTNGVYSYTRNGVARNVFLGPIPAESEKIEETHEISATVVYEGLTVKAKQFIYLEYEPLEYDKFGARFLMEVDGGWRGIAPNQTWGGGGWLISDTFYNTLWTDGSHYKRIKVHRDPRNATITEFDSANAFRSCASQDDSELLELNSGQVISINTGDDQIEILHGEIYEETDPYTGEHSLVVGRNGFVDNGSAFIELNDEEDSDVTYFYIRINKFLPEYGRVYNALCNPVDSINDCILLGRDTNTGLTECDVPQWSPVMYLTATTTLFVNNQPLVLIGGGDMRTGIPPCPICLSEPLDVGVAWRRVTNYFYSLTLGDPLDNYIYPVTVDASDNDFKDEDEKTLLNHSSDIEIRVVISWKGQTVPDNTPVYISVGDNTGNTAFVAGRNIYYTRTDTAEGYSYVDVFLSAREIPEKTVTEQVEIYSTYDKNGKTSRRASVTFNLTLDKKDAFIEVPVLEESDDPSLVIEEEDTPFSGNVERYNISTNEWDTLTNMVEKRGNMFSGNIGDRIYAIGGLKNNSLDISDKNEEYNIISNKWEEREKMSAGRFAGMSVVVGNNIYMIGGMEADNSIRGRLNVSISTEVYYTETNTWDTLANMPIVDEAGHLEERLGVAFGVAQHVEINSKNYIYIMGGIQDVIVESDQFNIQAYNRRVLRYCIEDNNWEYSDVLRSNELLTYQRISPLAVLYDNKIIVFNGAIEFSDQFTYPLHDFYIDIEENFATPAGGEWVKFESGLLGNFPVPKFQTCMAEREIDPSIWNSEYYIFGGSDDSAQSLDVVEKITSQETLFGYEGSYDEDVSVALASLLKGRHGASAVYSDVDGLPYVYLIGGYTDATTNAFVDISFDI